MVESNCLFYGQQSTLKGHVLQNIAVHSESIELGMIGPVIVFVDVNLFEGSSSSAVNGGGVHADL